MVSVVYRVALVATLATLALLVVALPQGYAQEAPPAPMVEGFPVPQDEDQAQNLRESIAKGCTAENLFEDLSCKGPEYRGYELISEEESSDSSSSTTDCFVVDVSSLSEQEVSALQSLGFYQSVSGEMRSPQCAEGEYIGAFPDDVAQQILQSECFDVVGESFEEATVEFLGCPVT